MPFEYLYLLIGLLAGVLAAWVTYRALYKGNNVSKGDFDAQVGKYNLLNNELGVEKEKVKGLTETLSAKETDLNSKSEKNTELTGLIAVKTTEYSNIKNQFEELKAELSTYKATVSTQQNEIQNTERNYAVIKANLEAANTAIKTYLDDISQLKSEVKAKTDEFNEANKRVSEFAANNSALTEKLETQKSEMETLRKQFNTEFENIATKILDEKTEKFTKVNQENIATILKPLGENLDNFKKKVEEVYDKESKERFSLGKEVEKLVLLNQKVSEEANNLTNALKGSSKTQGDWGQMILENILEKSGLVKDREYFVQAFLKDDDGNYLKNEDGSKMQPDVIFAYPDNRKVIVDSKVSLTAYTRYASTDVIDEQKRAIDEHIKSLRRHIEDLSRKNYQDFARSLDFVMMFVPNEPAYLLALQHDPEIWHFAYNKRILLISPTNLIAALKMIVDLWKRENQNRNAQEIAKRGSALYDKLVSFVSSLSEIGVNLSKAQKSYDIAFGQLKDGQGNLVWQAEKLKELGLKTKKNLPPSLSSTETDEGIDTDVIENR